MANSKKAKIAKKTATPPLAEVIKTETPLDIIVNEPETVTEIEIPTIILVKNPPQMADDLWYDEDFAEE